MNTVKFNSGEAKVIAHRGLSGIERENTVPAFIAAANRSYFGIETDVHVTRDGKFVIVHDESVERVSLGECKLNVENSDYEALRDIILPDTDGSRIRSDIRIPLLGEYISVCKKYDKICVLELKNHFEAGDIERMLVQIGELEYQDSMIFISFDLDNCINLRRLLPDSTVQWLVGSDKYTPEQVVSILLTHRLDIDVYYKALNKELVDKLHSHGIKVNCWTVDDKDTAERLVLMGVDFITTNILE